MEDWLQIFEAMNKKDLAWKKIPASDGRLKAMARVLVRGDLQPHECITAIKNLSHQESKLLNKFLKESKGVDNV